MHRLATFRTFAPPPLRLYKEIIRLLARVASWLLSLRASERASYLFKTKQILVAIRAVTSNFLSLLQLQLACFGELELRFMREILRRMGRSFPTTITALETLGIALKPGESLCTCLNYRTLDNGPLRSPSFGGDVAVYDVSKLEQRSPYWCRNVYIRDDVIKIIDILERSIFSQFFASMQESSRQEFC